MGRRDKRGSRDHHLPEEIVEDILVKLPVKSIIRFQSVCKSYLNLIKSSRFINKHLTENQESLFAICLVFRNTNIWREDSAHVDRLFLSLCSYDEHKQTSDTWPVLNFELPVSGRRRSNLYLVDQFNGIMCLTNYDIIMLINPSLAEVKLLPIPLAGQEYINLVGFGFDNMTMDFMVVRVMALRSDGVTRQWGEVYSLRSNCWRRSDAEIPFVAYDSTNCSTFFNGVVHWCVATGMEGESLSWRILTFNLSSTDMFQQMEFPQGWCTNIILTSPGLFVLNQESLAFISYEYGSEFVNIWTMNKHGTEETWTKLYSIGPLTRFSKPISFLNNHKFLYTSNVSELILYDILDQSSVVCDHGSQIPREDPFCFPLCLEMGVCRSSLVSLNM